jgi:hypothetical protein
MPIKIKAFFSHKGSVLVFALVILAFSLIAALSIATLSITERRSSFATEKSSRSFQVADSGAEIILQKIYKGSFATLKLLAPTVLNGVCTDVNGVGVISGSTSDGVYKVSLYDDLGAPILCDSPTWRNQVAQLKSEGTSGNTIRAVEVAVAAAPTPGITGGCTINGSNNNYKVFSRWGNGCKATTADAGQLCSTANISSAYVCGPAGLVHNFSDPVTCICIGMGN